MGIKSFLDGFTRGRPQREPATPYALVPKAAGLGIGVSNFAMQRPHAPPLDSYRGAQGIQVTGFMKVLEGAAVITKPGLQVVDIVALANGPNTTPGYVPLYDPTQANR